MPQGFSAAGEIARPTHRGKPRQNRQGKRLVQGLSGGVKTPPYNTWQGFCLPSHPSVACGDSSPDRGALGRLLPWKPPLQGEVASPSGDDGRVHCRLAWPISLRGVARKTTICRAGVHPRRTGLAVFSVGGQHRQPRRGGVKTPPYNLGREGGRRRNGRRRKVSRRRARTPALHPARGAAGKIGKASAWCKAAGRCRASAPTKHRARFLPAKPPLSRLRRQLPSVGEPLGGCRLESLPCKGLRSRAPPAAD